MSSRFLRTRIVATLGPATCDAGVIRKLIKAGIDVARINFAHSGKFDLEKLVETVRSEASKLGRPLAIMGDLGGPKLRTGETPEGDVHLVRGTKIRLFPRQIPSIPGHIGVNLPSLTRDVKKGHRVLINDGQIRLRTTSVRPEYLTCVAETDGIITARRGLNLPDSSLSVPALTPHDKKCVQIAVKLGFDLLALSFVRQAKDIVSLQRLLKKQNSDIPVIAKIEKPEALRDLPAIVKASYGVMVARGDLGVELSPEEVPLIQKRILAEARRQMKPTIVATQMMESMIDAPTPTRAEASDIANAVFDRTDALMLSGETAIGKYPVETVRTMRRIALAAEGSVLGEHSSLKTDTSETRSIIRMAAGAAVDSAAALGARYLICYTESGRTARMLSGRRPPVPILAFTTSAVVVRRLCISWGVFPNIMKTGKDYDSTIREVSTLLLESGVASKGDKVVMLTGTPIEKHGEADTIKLFTLGTQ